MTPPIYRLRTCRRWLRGFLTLFILEATLIGGVLYAFAVIGPTP